MAFRTGDGLEVNGILVVDEGGNIQSVPAVAINQAKSAMDATNLKLEVNGNASIRGANALFFGVTTNNYNSWKTKIWNNNSSTMYVNAQEFNVNNSGYGSLTFLKANASGVDGTTFRDLDNTAYYANPAGTSVFNGATFAATPTVNGNTVLTSNAGINANNINSGTLNNDRLPNFVHLGNASGTGYSTDDGSWGSRLNVSSSVHAKIEVSQQANSMRSHWYAHTGQDSIKFGTSTSHDVEFQRNNTTVLELAANDRVKINGGTTDYTGHSNVDQHILSLQTDYTAAGDQNFHFVNHNGNWNDGTSGGDTAYGLLWGYQNNVRAGIHYDHRGIEKFDFYSSYGDIRFRTPASANGNISPIGSETTMPARLTIATGGAVTIPHSVRSDIFYDNANTAFYVDPEGNSKLYGTLYLGHTNSQTGTLVIYDTGNNGLEIKGNGSNSFQFDMIGTGSTGSLKINDLNVGIGADADTGHRLKVSTSGHNYLWIEATSGSNEAMTRYKNPTSNNWYTGIRNGTSNNLTNTSYHVYSSAFGATAGGWNASGQFFTANEGYALGSFRAPIFYDSADTTYYEDPASSRLLKGLTHLRPGHSSSHNEVLRIGRTDDLYRYHSIFATNNSTASILEFRIHDGGNSTAQTSALSIRQNISSTGDRGTLIHHGTRLGFDESGTRSWTMKASGGGLNIYSGDGAGQLVSTITGGFRAPIFYDVNNTSYYTYPSSSSRLNQLRANVIQAGTTSALSSAGNLAVYDSGNPYISFHTGTARTAYIQELSGRFYFGEVPYTESEGSFRAPVFYDSNNAAYYLDASSTGTSLNVAGNAIIPGYASIAGVEFSSGVTRSLNSIADNSWVTIANFSGARKQDIIEIHDDESSRHNMLKMQVAWSFGQGSIQIINGVRHSARTISQVRMLYNTADRTYGTGKLQVYLTSWGTSRTLHIKQQAFASGNWGRATIPSTAETGLPSGYTIHEGTTLEANEDVNGTFGTTGRAVVGQGIDVFHGSPIKFHTTAGDGISTERGFIDAQEGGHLRIATSGGENIVFQDAGLGGTTNLTLLGTGEMVKEATERFTIKSHTNSWDGGLRFYASNNSTIFQMHPDTNGQMYVDREWRFQNSQINYGPIRRGSHHSGFLEGSYNNIGGNATKSNPIYTIGSSYNPSDAALGNMYGVGYSNVSASFISGSLAYGDWGFYVAADGDARIFLDGTNGHGAFLGSIRASSFYDIDNTSYYVNPGDTTISGKFRQTVIIGDGTQLNSNDGGWGARLNLTDSVHSKIEIGQDANSIKSHWYVHSGQDNSKFGTSTNHHLELQTSGTTRFKLDKDGGTTNTGNLTVTGDVQSDRYDDQGGTFLFKKGSGSGRTRHLNLADTTTDPASVSDSNNPTGISWGQRSDNNGYYMLGLKGSYSNGLSTHSRLSIGWHTGIEIGGNATYGGVRFMSDSPFVSTNEIMSIGKGDSHVRVINNVYAKAFYDIDSTSYYLNPASTSFLDSISVKVGAENTGGANSSLVGLIMRYGGSSYNNNTWAHKLHKYDHGGGVPLYLSETVGTGSWSGMQRWGSYSGDNYKNVFFSALKVVGSVDADAFYDRNDTQYMMDLSTNNNSLVMRGTIHVGPEGNLGLGHLTHPKRVIPGAAAAWAGSGTTTGQVVIDLPGTLSNYDMLYFEVDVYEYSAKNATKIIVGGHNWNSGANGNTSSTMWHNVGVKVIGDMDKSIYFGWRNNGSVNKRVMVIGSPTSSWSYGTVRVSSVSGADDFYTGAIDYTGDWAVTQSTSSSYYTKSPTTDFNSTGTQTLKTHGRMQAYGYQGNGNVGGTGSASWHPSGVYSNGTNWLYGQIVMNNNYISGCRYIAVGADNSESHILRRNNANNTEIRTHASGSAGLLVRNGADQFRFQLYGDGSNYGFLDGVWASWDLQKTTNGAMYMNGNTTYYMRLEDSSTSINVAGAIVAGGNVTAYSDRRVKEDIIPITNSLDKVQELNGVTFRRTDLADKSRMYAGLIAQDVEEVLPEAVEGNSMKRVDYNAVIGLLVESIKELKSEVDDLKEQMKNK